MRCHVPSALLALLLTAAAAPGQVKFLDESFEWDRDHPAAGHWLGNLQPGRSADTWAALLIARGDDGAWSASMTMIAALALDAPCEDLQVEGPSVAFTLPVAGKPRFSGTVSDDGQRLVGTIAYADAEPEQAPEGSFELARTPRPVDLPRMLAYSGELRGPGLPAMVMTLVFAQTPGGSWVGHLDVPGQGLMGFPLLNVTFGDGVVSALVAMVPFPAQIEGTIDADERRITGRFKQGPFDLELDFALDEGYAGPALARPQHPKPPFPYPVKDVTIEHPQGFVLAGTVTVPDGDGPFPGAVLISGSGAQDRDETILGHKPFLVIADYLTRHGIAVLRYDDRGTGGSTGSFADATTEDLATDTAAALAFLKKVERVDPARVGLIGHSEGGIIAPMVASADDGVAFIVLLAGPGVRGDDLLRRQQRLILEAAEADSETIARMRAQQEAFFKLVLDGADEAALRDALRPMIKEQIAAMGVESRDSEPVQQLIESQVRQQASPWMRYFITYDPRPALERVKCPVLALNGTLDLQVWHEQNLPEIAKAVRAGGGDVTIRRYDGLNHLFQPAQTGSIMEYGAIETTFDEAVLADMTEWIRMKTGSQADG
jgi:pimeloyl-ACP methyl ester carboxylesterase